MELVECLSGTLEWSIAIYIYMHQIHNDPTLNETNYWFHPEVWSVMSLSLFKTTLASVFVMIRIWWLEIDMISWLFVSLGKR